MKIQVGVAVNAVLSLQNLTPPTNALDAYLVHTFMQKLSQFPEVQACDKIRRELVRKHGEKDRISSDKPESIQAFFNEYVPVALAEIDIDIKPLPSRVLATMNSVDPKMGIDMSALKLFLED